MINTYTCVTLNLIILFTIYIIDKYNCLGWFLVNSEACQTES